MTRREPQAEEELVHRIIARARRTTGALLGNPADADDASQLALIEVLGSARTYRGEASLESWADRIVVRTAMRFARSRSRRSARLAAVSDPENLPEVRELAPDLSDSLVRPVEEYLERLTETRRVAIVLRHVLGYSIDEVAKLTGVSRNTVKDRLVHARREFRRLVRRDRLVGAAVDATGDDPDIPAAARTA